jgi:hypothetical protein
MDACFDPSDDGMPPPSEAYQQAHPDWNAKPRGIKHGNLTVFSVTDLDTASPRGYLLKGIMAPGELSLWVGPPKCGKSFLMLHIAYLLSLCQPVFGRRVKRTRVLYVAPKARPELRSASRRCGASMVIREISTSSRSRLTYCMIPATRTI